MKLGKVAGNTESSPTNADRPGIAEQESSKSIRTLEEIRRRAYEIHIERGGIHGCDLDDWLQAEHELQEKYKEAGNRQKNK